ncbi:MAG: hypothetical protein JNL67_14535 [Planctomycetaceae bacterium]|nr:hypothetical protein [Planctomycetaceae bacterium]
MLLVFGSACMTGVGELWAVQPVLDDGRYRPGQTVPGALGNPILSNPAMEASVPAIDWGQSGPTFQGPGTPAYLGTPSDDPQAVFGYMPALNQGGGTSPANPANPSGVSPPGSMTAPGDPVQVQIFPRNTGVDLNVRNLPGRVPGEEVVLATGGVRVVIDSPQLMQPSGGSLNALGQGQQLVVQADNLVAWTNRLSFLGGSNEAPRWELYLEGNVIFSLGQRVVYANRMFYDVNQQRGTILDAEMLSPVPEYQGLIRLRADVLQQVNPQQFRAYGAAATTSRMGVPNYWLSSNEINLTRLQTYAADPVTGAVPLDPYTGQPTTRDKFTLDSYDNFINVFGRKVAYWPVFRGELDNPQYYLENLSIGNDSVYGFQVRSRWNMNQVLRLTPIEGTRWTGAADYLSERGPAFGSRVVYERQNGFVFPGFTKGYYDSWFLLEDQGLDNLGLDRRTTPLEEVNRGRYVLRHDHRFLNGDRLLGEFGYITDRNFLEQFYEREWDEDKDQATSVRYQRLRENRLLEVGADGNVNDFFTQTQWLPRADFSVIGQPLFGSRVTWYSQSHVGYADLKVGDVPTNAVDLAFYDPLAWEAEREGLRAGSRQELEFPIQLGPVKTVPYLLGDATYWGQDLTATEVTRLYGQAGIRASLPFWTVDPTIQSELFNLNGLAHKVNLETDFLYADANQDLSRFPLYDALDDDAQEHFRRRSLFNTFGLNVGDDVPLQFDERFYALRSGMQRYVAAPSKEIADDLMLMRVGINQRWQTKRGTPGDQKIIDWVTLSLNGHYFPKSDRDNFGEEVGMFDYDFRWHVGDRLAVLSDGYFDTFQDGLNTASLGLAASRPEQSDVYIGFRAIDGPINSKTLNLRLNYRLSHKWVFRGSNSWDFGNTGQIGQTFGATYIGESFLWYAGANIDYSRDNFGFVFSVEPRGIKDGRLGRLGGSTIPPPGVLGVE